MQDDAEIVQISRSDDVEGFFSGVNNESAAVLPTDFLQVVFFFATQLFVQRRIRR
jgi:hypothetical protein